MECAVDNRISEQLSIPVIVLVWLKSVDAGHFSCSCETCVRVSYEVIVVLVCSRFDQTEVSIYKVESACHLHHERSEYHAYAVYLVRHCSICLEYRCRTCRVSDQVEAVLLYKRQIVRILCCCYSLYASVNIRIRLAAALEVR